MKTVISATAKGSGRVGVFVLSFIGAALFALSLSGCAETYYAESYPTAETRYNTYYGPYYYPYYPYYSYYGGAYYSEY
jgi:hypothetical protein